MCHLQIPKGHNPRKQGWKDVVSVCCECVVSVCCECGVWCVVSVVSVW